MVHNILHLSNSWGIGGAERVLIDIVNNLNKDKFKSYVILVKTGPLYDTLFKLGVEVIVLEEDCFRDIGFIFKILNFIRKKRISIIHAHEFYMNVMGTLAGFLSRIPIVTTVHGKIYYCEKKRRRIAYRMVSEFSQMTTVSKDLITHLNSEIGIPIQKIATIHNGVDLNKFILEIDGQKKLAELKIFKEYDYIIGSIGNLRPEKGHIYLVRAAQKIVEKYQRCLFLFIGRGECEAELKSEISRLKLSDNCICLGFRNDVNEILKLLDIFVLPSLSECLPMGILEAMAAGIPVVSSDVGGIPEIICNGKNGFLVEAGDSGSFAERIITLIENNEIRKDFSVFARRTIKNKFLMSQMIKRYEKLYLHMLSDPPPPKLIQILS